MEMVAIASFGRMLHRRGLRSHSLSFRRNIKLIIRFQYIIMIFALRSYTKIEINVFRDLRRRQIDLSGRPSECGRSAARVTFYSAPSQNDDAKMVVPFFSCN